MYISGAWRGFWQQEGYGRQPMDQFELSFTAGIVRGRGTDIVGVFRIRGDYDAAGHVHLVKQYIGKHQVVYDGEPDGEGSILGTWRIDTPGVWRGTFLMQPEHRAVVADLPITTITPKRIP